MSVRRRFWAEILAVVATAAVGFPTILDRDWLEPLVGRDVDGGSGALEAVVVLVCLAATVALSGLARAEWRRPAGHGDHA